MNSNSSNNSKKILRRNFFLYLSAGIAAAAAITKLPFRLFQNKVKAETSIKIKANPFAVKREANDDTIKLSGGRTNG
ncbi:MAG: hypothetical protein IT280_03670 [Ignavibacteria bacterium]|nr:hypothetical protein [Ignavibacteria bacterium]